MTIRTCLLCESTSAGTGVSFAKKETSVIGVSTSSSALPAPGAPTAGTPSRSLRWAPPVAASRATTSGPGRGRGPGTRRTKSASAPTRPSPRSRRDGRRGSASAAARTPRACGSPTSDGSRRTASTAPPTARCTARRPAAGDSATPSGLGQACGRPVPDERRGRGRRSYGPPRPLAATRTNDRQEDGPL